MNVLILSQYYDPEPIPKPADLAQGLLAHGHTPIVITGFPNYPAGELYDGYSLRLFQHEVINDVSVNRVFEYPNHGTKAIWRFINYLSFMLSAPLATFRARKCDVIYVWHPPLTVGVAAWIISKLLRIPVVYDVQDIWPESVAAAGILSENGRVYNFLQHLERFVYRRMKHLIVVTEGAKRNLITKGVPEQKITVLPHWVDETTFKTPTIEQQAAVRQEFDWSNRFIILFAGNLGFVQGLDAVILAASRLPAESPVHVVFMGQGTAEAHLRQLTKESNVKDRISFVPYQSSERMPQIMGAADVLLVYLKRSVITDLVVPSKTVSYLAAGKPILMAMGGAGNKLIHESGAGVAISPDDPDMLAKAMQNLSSMPRESLDEFGSNGRRYIQDHLSRADILARYIDLLERTAADNQ